MEECRRFDLNPEKVTVDSWNNIEKYRKITDAFFIFDEQRVVGKGKWSKAFIEIARHNRWILLSATPGDTWMDYIPVFIANGFYRHRTDFCRQHVVWNPYVKWQQVDHYINVERLLWCKNYILVDMELERHTTRNVNYIPCGYDRDKFKQVIKTRWDPYEDCPIENVSRFSSVIRRVVNEDFTRVAALGGILQNHPKAIVFYNFDYELTIIREFLTDKGIIFSEWNGHKHEALPTGDSWCYLVQYTAGAEGWNCIETDTIIFYSMSYSYKATEQSMGRIDRLNTPFTNLWYFFLISDSPVDRAIRKSIENKKEFNEKRYFKGMFGANK